jgi:hypothetical protein
MSGSEEEMSAIEHLDEESRQWLVSAVKRLDHVHNSLEQIAQHSVDQATIDAAQNGQEGIESAQEDIREMEEEFERVLSEVRDDE